MLDQNKYICTEEITLKFAPCDVETLNFESQDAGVKREDFMRLAILFAVHYDPIRKLIGDYYESDPMTLDHARWMLGSRTINEILDIIPLFGWDRCEALEDLQREARVTIFHIISAAVNYCLEKDLLNEEFIRYHTYNFIVK